MKASIPWFRAFLVALLSAGLASCATSPPATDREFTAPDLQARQAEQREDYARAADYWAKAADSATGQQSQVYQLNAAEAWLKAGDRQNAFAFLDRLQADQFSAADSQRYMLLRAEQAFTEGDVAEALAVLDRQDRWQSASLEQQAEELTRRIQQVLSSGGHELLQRIAAELRPATAYNLTEANSLLVQYEYVPSGKLREASTMAATHPRAASWAELMVRLREALFTEERLVAAAQQWVSDYPHHEIGENDFLELAFLYSQRFQAPPQVAVLIPTRGGLATAGTAIRDGLLSAYLDNPGPSELKFYEPGDDPTQSLTAYRQAVQDGANWIIGPVRQQSVQAVAELGPPGTSTLALNDLPVDAAPMASINPIFTLSLSQDVEAAAIAGKMLELGIERVITLTADSAWGSRMELAFIDAFTERGGQIADVARFSESASDHSAELTRVLQIDQSRDRKDRLQAMLGIPLSFEPRLRDDFDAFFMSSVPNQARQIRPQLKFFEAGEKPLFAVSRVYSGIPDPTADRDLNGTILPLSALQLDTGASSPPAVTSIRGGSLLSLYALGQDAWDLLRWLPLLQLDPDLSFPGATGTVKVTANGRLQREPAWAVFSAGRPVNYDPASAPTE